MGCKVDDQGIVYVKGIYAAEQRPRVLDVRVESYILRQSRLAAPQSGTAPDFVEGRAVQEFENRTNGICRHRYTDPTGRRAFHRGRDVPECPAQSLLRPGALLPKRCPTALSLAEIVGPLTVTEIA